MQHLPNQFEHWRFILFYFMLFLKQLIISLGTSISLNARFWAWVPRFMLTQPKIKTSSNYLSVHANKGSRRKLRRSALSLILHSSGCSHPFIINNTRTDKLHVLQTFPPPQGLMFNMKDRRIRSEKSGKNVNESTNSHSFSRKN